MYCAWLIIEKQHPDQYKNIHKTRDKIKKSSQHQKKIVAIKLLSATGTKKKKKLASQSIH